MNKQEMQLRVLEIIEHQTEKEVDPATPLKYYDIDSLDTTVILYDVEQDFNVKIELEDEEKLKTVDDIVAHLLEKM